jgi:hypothetical protein
MGTAPLINEMLKKCTYEIDSTYCINEAILCSGNNDVDHISEEVRNNVDEQMQTRADPFLYRPYAKGHFPMGSRIISDILLFIS